MANRQSTNSLPSFPEIEGVKFAHVPGWPGYAASDDGQVWSSHKANHHKYPWVGGWRKVPTQTNPASGHPYVNLRSKTRRTVQPVHVLVLSAFVPKPSSDMEVCHWPDATPTNCRLDNLMWGTRATNRHQGVVHGSFARGTARPDCKLSDDDVRNIFRLRRDGWTHQRIADHFKVSRRHVGSVLSGDDRHYLFEPT